MVTEPPIQGATTGETVPYPSSSAELGVVTSRGFSSGAATLKGLFTSRGETLDPVKDAQTNPGTFSPRCEFTGQLLMRAGGCLIGLGWYNATEGTTTPPPESEIYEILPATFPTCPATIDPATSCCDDADFCPLASHDTSQVSQHRWNMVPFSAAAIRADARFAGGSVGFVLRGRATHGQCSQNKYSQLDLNEKSPSGQAWVAALVYPSTVEPNSYYLAFESEPTTSSSWKGSPTGATNDGDFNDYVIFIKGACGDGGNGGARGTAGNGGSPAEGGPGGAVGGSPGAGGDNRATGGRGGAGGHGGSGASGSGGAAGGGASASGGYGGAIVSGGANGGATASDAGVDGNGGAGAIGGVPAASSSKSGCSYAPVRGDGVNGPLGAGMILALALVHRRRRRDSA